MPSEHERPRPDPSPKPKPEQVCSSLKALGERSQLLGAGARLHVSSSFEKVPIRFIGMYEDKKGVHGHFSVFKMPETLRCTNPQDTPNPQKALLPCEDMGVSEIRGTLFGGPYNKDPTI